MDLNLGVQSDTDKKLKKKLLIDYLYANLKQHNFWAYRYFFCEFLAFINVTGQFLGIFVIRFFHLDNLDMGFTYNFKRALDLCGPDVNQIIWLIIVIPGQIILLDKFFDGTFFTYGIEVMAFADRDQAWVAVLTTFITII